MGGEFSYYTQYDQQNVLNLPGGAHGRSFEDFASQYHISYIIGNDQFKYHPASRIKQAAMATGYKFEITEFASTNSQTRVTVKNIGIAPIYYDAYVYIDDQASDTSLKGLLPNESISFVVNAGGEQPQLSIRSERLVEGQTIQYKADL